jgi:hypothetical protein
MQMVGHYNERQRFCIAGEVLSAHGLYDHASMLERHENRLTTDGCC